jgi:hypothetical protein
VAKKEYTVLTASLDDFLEPELSMDDLLTIPEDPEGDIIFDDEVNAILKSDDATYISNREMEMAMNDVHGVNSMKDLRPDDYKGFTISLSKLFNVIKNRKG